MTVEAGPEEQVLKLEDYEGKRVTVVVLLKEPDAESNEVTEITGVIEKGRTGMGVIIKPRGRGAVELIDEDDIDNIFIEESTRGKIKSKRIDPTTPFRVKHHLLHFHGKTLSAVNGMTDEQAIQMHDSFDHADLGHHHEVKKKKPESDVSKREQAIAAASAQPAN